MDPRRVKQLDASSLRVLAHPLRVRLVGRLRIAGPATATMLADDLGESSGATSYHLRALAKAGFVEEEVGRGTGRERWWRAAQEMTSWRREDFAGDPDAEAAEEWLIGFHARRSMEWIDDWLARRPKADTVWMDVADQSDYWLRMTPDRLKAMLDEVHDVTQRHIDAAVADGVGDDPAARLVRFFLFAVPDEPGAVAVEPEGVRRQAREATAPPLSPAERPSPAEGADGGDCVLSGVDRRFLALTVTRWLPTGLTIPVTGLLMLSRGLSLAEIGLGLATQGAVVVVLELPTGGLADALGRRPVLLAATALDLVSLGLILAAGTPAAFLLAMGVQGVYRALESGPLEAWYVDARLAGDPGADLQAGLARSGVAVGLAIATGGLVTAALATWQPVPGVAPLAVPLVAALGLRAVDLVALWRLLDERRAPRPEGRVTAWSTAAATPAVVRAALSLLRATPALLALVAIEVLWGAGLCGVEMFSAPRLAELLGDAERGAAVAGIASAVAWTMCAGGSALTGWFSRVVGGGPARAGAAARIAQGAAIALAAVVAGPAGMLAGYFAFYLVHGAANAVHYGMVHRLVDAEHRATIISASSVAARLGGILAGVVLGAVAAGAGIPTALGVAAALLAVAAPLYRVAGRDPRVDAPASEAVLTAA